MHLPVPGMESFRKPGMVTNMVQYGPFGALCGSSAQDIAVEDHREPPPGIAGTGDVTGTPARPADPPALPRVEREVVWGFPAQEAALLAVRISFRDGEAIRKEAGLREPLCATIESMSAEALRYKGLAESRNDILAWLRDGANG